MRIAKNLGVLVLAGHATLVAAQDEARAPLKAGLWQVSIERDVNGRKAPDLSERLATMTPEARRKLEAMLKQRGVDTSGGAGKTRVCLNSDSLAEGRWMRSAGRCKTDYSTRTASAWKWHSVCTNPASQVDGEAAFANPESYSVKMAITSSRQGKPQVVNQLINASWLSADCGDVKPLQAPGKP